MCALHSAIVAYCCSLLSRPLEAHWLQERWGRERSLAQLHRSLFSSRDSVVDVCARKEDGSYSVAQGRGKELLRGTRKELLRGAIKELFLLTMVFSYVVLNYVSTFKSQLHPWAFQRIIVLITLCGDSTSTCSRDESSVYHPPLLRWDPRHVLTSIRW